MTTGTEDYYRERAPEYDQVYSKLERQEDLQAIRAWLPDVLRGRRVLDVASGTGYWTGVFAEHAAFVGFFWSHIPLASLDLFLSGLFGRLDHDSVVVFMDNRYVEGSNHPIVRTDDQGNSFQRRTLRSGTEWEVLKNFPSPEVLKSTLEQYAPNVTVRCWDYYWAATCTT